MTHRERLLAALRLEVPDQVPVTWELVGRCAYALFGRCDWKAIVDAHRLIGSSVFNLQGLCPAASCQMPDGYSSRRKQEPQPGGGTLHTNWISTPKGVLEQKRLAGYLPHDPTLGKTVEYFVKQPADYEPLIDHFEQYSDRVRLQDSASREARDYIGQDGLAGYWMCDSLYQASTHRHSADFITDLVDIPGTVHRLLEAIDPLKEKEIAAFNESAADVLVYDVCWASTSLLNPKLVREFVLPRARKAAETVSRDKIWGFFTSGRTWDVLPDLVDCEPDYIQHFDVLGDCDLAEAKRCFGRWVAIVGNYSPVVLARGNMDDARREAQRCLDAAMAGGGYIMSTSDEVPADAKLDNMKAVVEHVARHGRY
jgi:hypothetical protein